MNEFVAYLNSVNNIGGNTTGSLAEAQVKSQYYERMEVDRQLSNYVAETVKSKNYKAFILTGHAGDGKTSILVQVLKKLGYLNPGEGLDREKEYKDFYYVKDMSEIPEDHQVQTLIEALSSTKRNKSSLLISNTGPLLRAFTVLEETKKKEQGEAFTSEDQISLQSTLLSQLDKNDDNEVEIAGYQFFLINIARVDNVLFAPKILKHMIDDSLWTACAACECKDRCPILNNQRLVSKQFDRVSSFVEHYYRYLFENDKRMTIRQMVGQLSYAITGNLTCSRVSSKYLKEPFFNYNFANLFFGCYGIDELKPVTQIKGIEQIRILGIDKTALDVDYRLFVNHDLSFFTPDIQLELEGLNNKYRQHYQIASEDQEISSSERKTEMKFRRAIRRFYLMYSQCDSTGMEGLLNQVFGANYVEYWKLISKKQPKHVLRNLQSTIFQALYIKNTGSVPDGTTELPLTLRREDDVFQNVMLVLGRVNKGDLEVIQIPASNPFEDYPEKQIVALKLKGDVFRLSLPMVNYFQELLSGAIASNNNPALTHGIATLDALLLDHFSDSSPESEEDCEIRVIINTTSGQEIETISLSENHLNVW